VILESGIAGSLLGWSLVQPRIAEFATVCSYDRAGLGWSDRCPAPRTVPHIVAELATLLERANLPPPFVLVGHSFGGLLIRAYAHLRPHQVAGLVLVDPVSLQTWAHCAPPNQRRLESGIRLSRRGALLARFGVVKLALWTLASGGRRFRKLIANATARRGASAIERFTDEVRRLPPEVWPMIRAHWSHPKSFKAMAAYLECLPAAAALVLSMSLPPELPMVVLSAANATEDELGERDGWIASNPRGKHVRVENSAHWIQLEQPDAVISAIRTVWHDAGAGQTEDPQRP
jgi:pimeloyl-ACP methyl ester carboxylesterase